MTEPTEAKPQRFSPLHLAIVLAITGLVLAASPASGTDDGTGVSSRRSDCANNLKQLGLAMAMYANVYGGPLPMDSAHPTLVGSLQLLSNTISTARILHCPSDETTTVETNWATLTTNNISYSYIPNLIWQDRPDSVVALDRIYTTKKGSRWPSTGNHGVAGGNVLFVDGHVSWQTALPAALTDRKGAPALLSP